MQAAVFSPYELPQVQPVATLQVRTTHIARVRGYEVELYGGRPVRSRSGGSARSELRFVDVGEWRQGGYVRWVRERVVHTDFFLLDEVDELLRAHFPAGAGTVHRADQPISIPSVRLSSVR